VRGVIETVEAEVERWRKREGGGDRETEKGRFGDVDVGCLIHFFSSSW